MEWNEEPNSKDWTDETTGVVCRIKRVQGLGTLCGYVKVPTEHQWHGMGYEEIDDEAGGVDVHGGLTFAARQDDPDSWWIGFDCAHYGDVMPGLTALCGGGGGGVYRNMEYVTAEVEKLARQMMEQS